MRQLRISAKSRYTDVRLGSHGEVKPIQMVDRQKAMYDLLRPIRWDWSSSVSARRNLVVSRHRLVRAAYPFMDQDERQAADEWFERERHGSLWE